MKNMRLIQLTSFLLVSLLPGLAACSSEAPTSGNGSSLLPPDNLSVTGGSDSTITLNWDLNSLGEEEVTLERRIMNSFGSFNLAVRLPARTTQHTDSLLNPNLGYEYRLRVLAGSRQATSDTFTVRNDRVITDFGGVGSIVYSDVIDAIAFNPEGNKIAFGSANSHAEIWDLSTAQPSFVQRFSGHASRVTSVAFSPDGTRLLTGSHDFTARLWNVNGGNNVEQYTGHNSFVRSVTFSPNGNRVLTASTDGSAKLWETSTGALLTTFSTGTNYEEAAYSPLGTRIAAAGNTAITIDIWNLNSNSLVGSLSGHSGRVLTVDYGPDGILLASGGEDNTVRIWNLATQQVQTLGSHNDDVNSVSVSPDGKYVASAGDISVIVWDLTSNSRLATFTGHNGIVRSVDFSRDGTLLASGSSDNSIRFYGFQYEHNGWEMID